MSDPKQPDLSELTPSEVITDILGKLESHYLQAEEKEAERIASLSSYLRGRVAAMQDIAQKLPSAIVDQTRARIRGGELAAVIKKEKLRIAKTGTEGEEAEVLLVSAFIVDLAKEIKQLLTLQAEQEAQATIPPGR